MYAATVRQQQSIKAIADTAASGTYGPVDAEKAGLRLPHEPIEVTCANELNMKSVSTILLPILTQLPTSARKLSTFSEMKNILLSIPTIVDADCEVHLGLKFIKIYKDNKLILEGNRDEISQMWTIDLVVPTTRTTTPTTNLEKLVAKSVQQNRERDLLVSTLNNCSGTGKFPKNVKMSCHLP